MKEKLVELLGADVVADAPEILEAHAGDKWFASNPPEVVVFAETTDQVSKLLKFASANKIPVTARGAGLLCRRLRSGAGWDRALARPDEPN